MICERSDSRDVSFPGTVPRRSTDFACVNTVFVRVDGEAVGEREGVDESFLVGVNNETVRLTETGVMGMATSAKGQKTEVYLWSLQFFWVLLEEHFQCFLCSCVLMVVTPVHLLSTIVETRF
jgi:hypothetical protein